MPSTVADVFQGAGLRPSHGVAWCEQIPSRERGVYVVALSARTDTVEALSSCPIQEREIERLLTLRPQLRVCASQPSAAELAERLAAFWLPDETVLYIGLAGRSLQTRVDQYYRTPLGARGPHAGGWWLKTLSVLDRLYVYWAVTDDHRRKEKAMLRAFAARVAPEASESLPDRARIAPFANLRDGSDLVKRHCIRGATG